MLIQNCRVCGGNFFPEPLLQFKNMPKHAQFFPSKDEIATERGVDLDVWQCSGCGLVQLASEPVPYYKEVVRAAAFSEEMGLFRRNQFDNFVKKYSLLGKKIIEVGCGRGEYLTLMQQAGVDAFGVEYSQESVNLCQKMGLKVSKGFIQSADERLDFAPFDAFFILNYLEHLPDPNATLRGVYANLSEEAFGLIEVPNFDMIVRNHLFSEFISDHLFYFTRDTLCSLLERNGFEVVACEDIWHDYIISAVVKKRIKVDLSKFINQQAHIKKEVNDYIDQFGEKRVAVWGAGHQALAVIALTGIAGKIRYVIDSATFKQSKFTPATHIPIVSPEIINVDPVDAIIVMVASYSDEVVKTIRQNYSNTIMISILRSNGLELITI